MVALVSITPASAARASAWPLQLEMRVPFEPTAFPSDGRTYLAYELHLTNFTADPLTLRRIEVQDADAATATPIAALEGERLDAVLQSVGPGQSNNRREIAGGGSVVVFLWLVLDRRAHLPERLRHQVFTADSAAEGAVVGTHHTELKVLASPVQGANWTASDGPSNDQDNHHRRGIFVFDGIAVISRRYAIDWMQSQYGVTFSGDGRDMHSYHAYGKPVFAVADSTVVTARDGLPDNVPGHGAEFSPAVPMTLDTVAGNTISLDLGGGQFAYYMHLLPGSLLVKTGDHVHRGQILARIGDSGDAREPHLHFEITTSPKLLAGEGLPYLIDQFRITISNGKTERRTQELPLRDMLVDFGEVSAASPLR
jgi:murein DD-endopeptidase MepM/ murein hydrolase activator NlpD